MDNFTLHPGLVRCVLGPKFAQSTLGPNVTELEVAQAIRDGKLPSPQRFHNVWLFNLRITGTGTAYRRALDEFVYRPPENYLTDEFLARCNGLTVIVEHPEENLLNSEQFKKRNIGAIMLPYISGDEVWGISRVYDDEAAEIMAKHQLSTSPSVYFTNTDDNTKLDLADGRSILIEGKPGLLDHLAVCLQGVWDKGGPPTGVDSAHASSGQVDQAGELPQSERTTYALKDSAMPTENESKKDNLEEVARKDSGDGESWMKHLEKISSAFESLANRITKLEDERTRADSAKKDEGSMPGEALPTAASMDADKAKKDTEEGKTMADKAKKDAEKAAEEEAKAKKDAEEEAKRKEEEEEKARKDADERIARLESAVTHIPKSCFDDDYSEMAKHQAKADSVYAAFGDSAPGPLRGETLQAYRTRLASGLKNHSEAWKGVDLSRVDSSVLSIAEEQIYADAAKSAMNPTDIPEDMLIERTRKDETGRVIKTFIGKPSAWTNQFKAPRMIQRQINKGA
jgi:hypothetical protein